MTAWQSTVPAFQEALAAGLAADATITAMTPPVQVGFGEEQMPEAQYVWLRDVSQWRFAPKLIATGVYPSDEAYTQDVLIRVQTPDDATPASATSVAWALWRAVTGFVWADPSIGGVVRTCLPGSAEHWAMAGAEYSACRLLGRLRVEARI